MASQLAKELSANIIYKLMIMLALQFPLTPRRHVDTVKVESRTCKVEPISAVRPLPLFTYLC